MVSEGVGHAIAVIACAVGALALLASSGRCRRAMMVYRTARAFGVSAYRAAYLAARFTLTGSTGKYGVKL